MIVDQPITFTLTDPEAAQLQSCQLAQQRKVVGTTRVISIGSLAVPIIIIAVVAAIDWAWYDWTLPPSYFVLLMLVFVAGMATQTAGYWLNLRATKQRLREQTRQVFEQRTVRLTDEGIEQALPELRSLHLWRGIDRIEQVSDLVVVWAGNLIVSAIPVRAFPSEAAMRDFLDECRRRADGAKAAARGPSAMNDLSDREAE